MVDEGDDDRAAEEVGGSGGGAAEDGGDEAEDGGYGGDVEGEKAPGAERSHGMEWRCLFFWWFFLWLETSS